MPEIIDNPEITKTKRNRERRIAMEGKKGMTLAEQLTLRAKEQKITIPLKNSMGAFTIEVRVPTMREMNDILSVEARYVAAIKAGDIQQAAEVGDGSFELIASLCLDPSITAEFLKSGAISQADFLLIVRETIKGTFRPGE